MPSRAEIVSFDDSRPSAEADSWVAGAAPATGIEVTDPGREQDYVPELETIGFRLVIREIYHRAFVAAGLITE